MHNMRMAPVAYLRFLLPPTPVPSSSLPFLLEVGLRLESLGNVEHRVWGSDISSPAGSEAEPRLKSYFVHYCLTSNGNNFYNFIYDKLTIFSHHSQGGGVAQCPSP